MRDRTFWVTGAGTGYGRCIAIALAAAGAKVFLTGRRTAKLGETRAEAESLGINTSKCVVVPADITDSESVLGAVQAIASYGEPLFGLINSAAVPEPPCGRWPLLDISVEQWQTLLATNVTGQWLVSNSAMRLMTGPALRVIFMTSEAGWAFTTGFGPYNVTKAALNNLGASLAAECAARDPQRDIQVNVLVPGEARTEMNQGSHDSPFSVVCMALLLLSQPKGGPNGCFFHRDGRHLVFTRAEPYTRSLLEAHDKAAHEEFSRRVEKNQKVSKVHERPTFLRGLLNRLQK